ncbi:MAG: hypothetical protein C0594_02160 [Marinilabiliales bacterium]|nr:MAG: hypothetical protein C0594_02160 [Marinilabiliales bacterium]
MIRNVNKKIPVICQTAFAFSEDKIKCYRAGCNEYVTKPINNDELMEKISTYLQ